MALMELKKLDEKIFTLGQLDVIENIGEGIWHPAGLWALIRAKIHSHFRGETERK
jgi:hypothetical protein